WLTIACSSREELLEIARRYRSWSIIERSFHQAHIASEAQLRKQEVDGQRLSHILQLLSTLIFPISALRTSEETIAANRLGQSGLWPFGISGDYPILLVRIHEPQQLDLLRELLIAHRYWRDRGLFIDLVVLNEQRTNYGAELHRLLYRLVTRTNSDNWLHQRGGIFILYADQMNADARTLLLTAARVVLDGENGSLGKQLPGYTVPIPHLPAFVPSRMATEAVEPTPPLPPPAALQFFNGYGGFSPDGQEYVIELPPGTHTPLPWTNVIGYPEFGFLVTEAGSSTTWALNSGENRLTPWSNDPVTDPTGEALYLRDEETGRVWTPTPGPAGSRSTYRVRHGAGYTIFEHHSHGLRQQLRLFADPADPVKIVHLRLENTWNRPRRLTVTQYVEWVLGTLRAPVQQYIIPEYVADREALLAANPYSAEFAQRVAFLAASRKVHGMTADRLEFLGRNGSMRAPMGLRRIGLERRTAAGDHPCAVLQVHIDLAPGEVQEVYFVLGQGQDRAEALALIEKYQAAGQADDCWQRVQAFWDRLLGAVSVETPDPAVNLLLNRWLLYQTLSCRIWGRSAFYQSSGAYGFRDQLQDVMAVLPSAPEIAREQILNAARHQFEAGDVLHWWHPPSGRGVRTRMSDDLLWLPYTVAEYVRATGDATILAEEVPFRQAPPLREDEEERYGEYPLTVTTATLLDHCERAVQKGSTQGPHGLPLMGTGDWNDGMSRVGAEGRGESVWLAWFLHETLHRFAWLCETTGRGDRAELYRQQADKLREAIEASSWDGEWYLRAFYDSGYPLGSRQNRECQIDSIAQSWAVLSGAGNPARARQAMESALKRLVRPEDRLLMLFTPPFDKTPHDPGYIKGYVPGIRENGGQYTHAATWLVWAFTQLEQGNTAGALYRLLNPIYQADSQAMADVYKVEPYVIAADVYSTPPHVRRGGWTWYTGSSGWMYRLGIEAVLGFKREGEAFTVKPVIPAEWEQAHLVYKDRGTTYQIHILNPKRVECGVASVRVDGVEQPDGRIPLGADGTVREVEIVLG
ncbi:MAG TPA: protein ndvB, partial [Anaerolineaceae bacterium]|nr:protein ndvB [Anaerolineaceae bacterium]